jgi:hypothetical protein
MARTITHFRFDLGPSGGEAIYLVTVDQQEVAGFPWWVILQSATPGISYLESFGVNCQSVEEALQKATDMLDRRHPSAPRTEEDLHIGMKADGTLTGAPFDVLAAMDKFIQAEQPERARQMISEDERLWIVALCSGTKKALAVCDYCIAKLAAANNE